MVTVLIILCVILFVVAIGATLHDKKATERADKVEGLYASSKAAYEIAYEENNKLRKQVASMQVNSPGMTNEEVNGVLSQYKSNLLMVLKQAEVAKRDAKKYHYTAGLNLAQDIVAESNATKGANLKK